MTSDPPPMALQTDGCPNGFHLLEVTGASYTTRLVPAHDPARSQMRLMLESQVHDEAPEVLRDYHPGALLRGPVGASATTPSETMNEDQPSLGSSLCDWPNFPPERLMIELAGVLDW